MRQFFSIVRHEFGMYVRRPGYWIAYILLSGFYIFSIFAESADPAENVILPSEIWFEAGNMVFILNVFMPLLAGILTADRMKRDFTGGIRELQTSSPFSRSKYILSKFLASFAGVIMPIFILTLGAGSVMVIRKIAPVEFLGVLMLAFLSIAVPTHAFVTAFSLVCPLVMPLRVYQVLFTGYWFWGNLLSPKAFPTISDTVLNAVGQYPLQAFFKVTWDSTHNVEVGHTVPEAVINLSVLLVLIILALLAANYYLRLQTKAA